MTQITQAVLTATMLRVFDDDSGDEYIIARSHIIGLYYSGVSLNVFTTNDTFYFEPSGDIENGIHNDVDQLVAAFFLGGASEARGST